MLLTARQLNRATLARQSLLQRGQTDVEEALRAIGPLQAQEPASPYLALWSRLARFEAADLTRAIETRRVIKATLHRGTLHLASVGDYLGSVEATSAVLRSKWMNEARGLPIRRTLPELTDEAIEYASSPRTNIQMRDFAESLGEPVSADDLWRRIRRYGAFVNVPLEAPWSFTRRPVHIAANAWLDASPSAEDDSLEHLVRSHLTAFGPARLADISQWSGISSARLKIGLERIGDLESYRDEAGHDLYDIAGAPLPDPDTPAPPRLLPMWDETLLAYKDRSRVLPEAYRKRVIVKAGDVLPTFTVDGFVAGLWWAETGTESGPRIEFEPFAPLTAEARSALDAEAQRLAAFVREHEPDVYARFRHTARRS